jgi:hypothetical protein
LLCKFNKNRALFTGILNVKLGRIIVKCYIWSIALYGAENWTLRAVDRSTWNILKCGAGEGWRRSVGPIM